MNSDARLGLPSGVVVDLTELDIGTEPTVLDEDRLERLGILAELAIVARGLDELNRPFDRELVGRDVVGNRSPLIVAALYIGPIAADPADDHLAVGIDADRDAVDSASVDLTEPVVDLFFETGVVVDAEIETP